MSVDLTGQNAKLVASPLCPTKKGLDFSTLFLWAHQNMYLSAVDATYSYFHCKTAYTIKHRALDCISSPQGCSKRWTPGCVKLVATVVCCLASAGRKLRYFQLVITQGPLHHTTWGPPFESISIIYVALSYFVAKSCQAPD